MALRRLIMFTLFITRIKTEMFTSMVELRQLIKTHKYVTAVLELEDIVALEEEHDNLKKYKKLYKREHGKMELDTDFIGNPVNAFLLIKRLTTDLYRLENYIWQRPSDYDFLVFPDEEDLQGATRGLWRLQLVYGLNVSQLAAGKFYGNFSREAKPYFEDTLPMLISDCMYIAVYICMRKKYHDALPWMLEGINKYYHREPDEVYSNDNEADIITCIVLAYIKIGNLPNATHWSERLLELRPDQEELRCEMQDFLPEWQQNNSSESIPEDTAEAAAYIDVPICRGENNFPEEKRKNLYCHYKLGPTPFLRLAPFKAEQLHHDPDILMFHDVISDKDIEVIQNTLLTQGKFNSSSVRHDDKKELYYSSSPHRVSKSAQLRDDEEAANPATQAIAAKLLRRIEHFSDLNGDYAEILQVTHYGIGGHYGRHHDFFGQVNGHENGNRIATALFYLSDVDQGGATGFTDVNLTIFPIKGSALLWYNLLRSGEKDYRSSHISCPVLRGYKWVVTLWLREFGQEFLRPCTPELKK